MTVAALFVQEGGAYFGLEGVDPWPESRDARLYPGPWPVVAHPPCERWGALNNLVLARYKDQQERFAHGNDGGCFASALASVRRWGGVLEHPANTRAWAKFNLPRPGRKGTWQRGLCGGWAVEVDQAAWGHVARKITWLYVFGAAPDGLSSMRPPSTGRVVRVYRLRNADGTWSRAPGYEHGTVSEITHKAAKATPPAFRDLLLSIARSAVREAE